MVSGASVASKFQSLKLKLQNAQLKFDSWVAPTTVFHQLHVTARWKAIKSIVVLRMKVALFPNPKYTE